MKVLKFNISGKTAFFKNPDMNAEINPTFNHIHKPALLGLLGAILGLKGLSDKKEFPEYYEKLKNLEISIVPEKEFFETKLQAFNNTTGFANKSQNLIINQIRLNNPKWTIYIKLNDPYANKIKDSLLNKKAVYYPYLGANDHFCNIDNVNVIKLKKTNTDKIDSLVYEKDIELLNKKGIFFKELEPIAYNRKTFNYEYQTIIKTDFRIQTDKEILKDDKNNIVFY